MINTRDFVAIAIVALTIGALGTYWFLELQEEPVDNDLYVASDVCRSCHPREYRAWHRTFHRTMTQLASPANVAAPVTDGLVVNAGGRAVEFHIDGEEISVTLPFLDGLKKTLPVKYTVGSHRMQQFVVDAGDQHYRIPVFYSLQDEKWMPISDAFFHFRDDSLQGFLRGYGLWDANCIFCHNTRPNPGMNHPDWTFEPNVAETGIACEECHGNGQVHEAKNHNPLQRFLTHRNGSGDPSMFHPNRVDQQQATDVCGQCHGQRVPHPRERIVALMTEGDPFRPGERLAGYYQPIEADTELDASIPLRFWPDGSPRLTAHEYQGLTKSRCYLESDLTCVDCHSGHKSEPRGLIADEMRGDAACSGCHEDLQTRTHAGHLPEQAQCRSCHMPEVVYGVMSIHPSHQIRNPDPGRTIANGMPNACNLCHLDKSVNWAAEGMDTIFGKSISQGAAQFDSPELLRGFAQGDAVYRVILLDAMQRRGLRHATIESNAARDRFGVVRQFNQRLKGSEQYIFGPDDAAVFEALRAAAPSAQPFEFGE